MTTNDLAAIRADVRLVSRGPAGMMVYQNAKPLGMIEATWDTGTVRYRAVNMQGNVVRMGSQLECISALASTEGDVTMTTNDLAAIRARRCEFPHV